MLRGQVVRIAGGSAQPRRPLGRLRPLQRGDSVVQHHGQRPGFPPPATAVISAEDPQPTPTPHAPPRGAAAGLARTGTPRRRPGRPGPVQRSACRPRSAWHCRGGPPGSAGAAWPGDPALTPVRPRARRSPRIHSTGAALAVASRDACLCAARFRTVALRCDGAAVARWEGSAAVGIVAAALVARHDGVNACEHRARPGLVDCVHFGPTQRAVGR